MLLWSALAFFAFGAVSKNTATIENTSSQPSSTIGTPGSITGASESTIGALGSTPAPSPPRPTFRLSMRMRDEITLPDHTEVNDIAWHAESNTARVVVQNTTTIYRTPHGDDQVQFLKIEAGKSPGTAQRVCTKSPPMPASPEDKGPPGVPQMERFQFVGYTTEQGQQIEHWQKVLAGEGSEVQEDSLKITHDFFVYRDGGDAVPFRYTILIDSTALGPISDPITHRYTLLSGPRAPLLPDTTKECDTLEDSQSERQRREQTQQKAVHTKKIEDILTKTLL